MVVFSLLILPDIFFKRKIGSKNSSIKLGLFLEDGVTGMN